MASSEAPRKNGRVYDVWKTAAAISISINLTLIGAWLTMGRNVVTTEQLRHAVETADYPWLTDRQIVMQHINSVGPDTIHEGDTAKRRRISEVLEDRLQPIREDLSEIKAELRKIKEMIP
jgi:hypothetical protein